MTLPLTFTAEAVFAQAETALEAAQRRAVCGSGNSVSSTDLPNGSPQVTCHSSGLPDTGLSTEGTAGVAARTMFIALVANDGESTTTTTTTTGGS